MNDVTNEYLQECLDEAHASFIDIISEMKSNHMVYDYDADIEEEALRFREATNKLEKLRYLVGDVNRLSDDHIELISDDVIIFVKYMALYAVTFLFLRGLSSIFDTSKMDDMIKYGAGLFLGSTYVGLLSKDIYDNRHGTKERRELINRLKTLKEEYQTCHDDLVIVIDQMFDKNTSLIHDIEDGKIKTK